MPSTITIDSNLWIYYLDRALPEHKKTAAALRKVLRGGVLVNTVIQMEVAHHLFKRLGPVDGEQRLAAFLASPFKVDPLDEGLVASSWPMLRRHGHLGIGGRDATVLASMARNGSTELWTHDGQLKRMPGITVKDPAE